MATLDLADCKLYKISANLFSNNLKLGEIDLSRNELKVINFDFSKLSQIRKLDFSGNTCISAYHNEEGLMNLDNESVAMTNEELNEVVALNCTQRIKIL